MAATFLAIGVIFFLGHGARWLFARSKIPDLLIMMLIGMALGPGLGLVHVGDFGQAGRVVCLIALAVILFKGGLELNARELLSSSLPALAISFLAFALIALFGGFLARLFVFESWGSATLFGLAIGSTSSAVVIPLVGHLRISERMRTVLALESAFTDVIAIVLFLGTLSFLLAKGTEVENGGGGAALALVLAPSLAVVIGTAAALLWSYARAQFPGATKKPFTTEAMALLVYGASELVGGNGALAVLAAGFVLANQSLLPNLILDRLDPKPISENEEMLMGEVVFLLRTFFFIYLGMSIQFASVPIILFALVVLAGILVTRWISAQLLFRGAAYSKTDRLVAIIMGPRGLACAVLAMLPAQQGWAEGELIQNAVFALIPMTILLTAAAVFMIERKLPGPSTGSV